MKKNLNSSTRDALGAQETMSFPHPESSEVIRHLQEGSEGSFKFVKDPFLRKHLYRMKVTYMFWERCICLHRPRYAGWREVLISNLEEGPAYADRISKLLTYSYRWRTGVAFYNFPPEYIDESAWGFDYFPSPFHLLPFEGESDDYKVTYNDVKLCPSLKDDFLSVGEKYVKKSKYDIFFDDVDVVSSLTSKAVLVGPWKTEPNLTARAKRGYPGDITEFFEYKELVIYKCPHEHRSCWIPNIPTYNSIKVAKKIVKELLRSPCDYYFRRPGWNDLREFLQKGRDTYFIMSDLKKSGLTFPHHLILWAKELIDSKNPDLDTSVFNGYVNTTVYKQDGKTTYKPNVGVGLGMADPLISWCISIIFLCWKKAWDEECYIHGMFWGDDQVIKIWPRPGVKLSAYKAAEIGKDWDRYQKRFGLTVHESKPFVGTTGCLLETYPDKVDGWDCMKRGQWVGSFFWALGAETIFQAKEYVNAVYTTLAEFGDMVDLADIAINEEIIPRMGYEFFPEEVNYPFELGGWTSVIERGLNQCVKMGLRLPPDKGGLAKLQFLHKNKARGSKYKVVHEDWWAGKGGPYFQRMVQSTLYPDYFRPSFAREREVYRKLAKRRLRAFQTPENPAIVYRKNVTRISCKCEMPDEFLARFDACQDFIDIEGTEALKSLEAKGLDPTRCRIYMDELLSKGDYSTTLSYYLPSFPEAQIAALRSIIGEAKTLSPCLFKWCEDEPRAYARQLKNFLERGVTMHPQIKREFGDIQLPFPVLGKGDTLGQDPYTGAYFLYDPTIIVKSNWEENTCWSAIFGRPCGNKYLGLIKKCDFPEEKEPIREDEDAPLDEPLPDDPQTVEYIRQNITAAGRALLQLEPQRDTAVETENAVYARYQLVGGGDESDFDLDGGIDFDDLGVG